MRILRILLPAAIALALTSVSSAQDIPEGAKPAPEHKWLQQFVGQWDSTSEAVAAPGQPAMSCKGQVTSRLLGELWLVSESQVEMMGTKVHAMQSIGYDPTKKKYVGTWIDSIFNHLWLYEGSVDAGGKFLTLEAEGPNFMAPGKTSKFRDVYEFKSKDHIVLTSSMLGDDGKWVPFMTGNLHRKK